MGTEFNFKVFGKEYTPQQIFAFILQKIKQDAEAYLGDNDRRGGHYLSGLYFDAKMENPGFLIPSRLFPIHRIANKFENDSRAARAIQGHGSYAVRFKIVMDDVEELIKATASQTGERIGDLRQRLEKKVEDARRALAEKTWFKTAEETKTRTESRLRENLWVALVIAAGIGVLLGFLMRRHD